MPLAHKPPALLDQSGTIESVSYTDNQGESIQTWSTSISGFKFGWLNPLRGSEANEAQKAVSTQKRSALFRTENRTIDATMRLVTNSENWYIQAVRPYMGSRNWSVLDLIYKDKE